jgi:hypothetical protein
MAKRTASHSGITCAVYRGAVQQYYRRATGVATDGRDICTHRERQGAWRPTLDAPRNTLDRKNKKNTNTAAPAGSRYYITAVQRTASIQILKINMNSTSRTYSCRNSCQPVGPTT